VHGLSIPLGKLGFFLPRTLSRAFPSQGNDDVAPFQIVDRLRPSPADILRERKKRRGESSATSTLNPSAATLTRPIYRIGGRVIRDRRTGTDTPADSIRPSTPPAVAASRTIRFPDDEPSTASFLDERRAAPEAELPDIAL
jgi:hypothetical protein